MARGELHPLSVAPMMDHTDRHLRWVLRMLTRRTLLYTEMVVGQSIRYGDRERLLGFDPIEHPVALQLGGDDPVLLAECAAIAFDLGYDELNLNVGCPSDRVRDGCFGAVLMRSPDRVADVVAAMRARVPLPVTVKHRIGVDDAGDYEDLVRFVDRVAEAGADRFVVHARIAVLGGLSPKENREIPPLRHADVHRLKRDRPGLRIEINGGLRTLDEVEAHLPHVDGVMIGRAVIDRPMVLADADQRLYGDPGPPSSREALLDAVEDYVGRWADAPRFRSRYVLRHLLALFNGERGAGAWRRALSERLDDGVDGLRVARAAVQSAAVPPPPRAITA